MTYGNLLTEPFADIWDRMSPWRENAYVPEKCKTCRYFNRCKGGCRISALAQSGNLSAPDPWMTRPITERPPKMFYPPLTDLDKRYQLAPIRWRKEGDDHYLLCTDVTTTLLHVTKEFINFVRALEKHGSFTANELIKQYGFDRQKLTEILGVLMKRRYLKVQHGC